MSESQANSEVRVRRLPSSAVAGCALATALGLGLAAPPFALWPFAAIALAPLIRALCGRSILERAAVGAATGVLSALATVVLPLGSALASFFDLPTGVPAHLVLAYEPGRLTAYLDGERRIDSSEAQGGLYHWRDLPLVFGDGDWRGRIEGVALYDRVLGPEEAAEAHRLYRAKLEARTPPPRTVVEAPIAPPARDSEGFVTAAFVIRAAAERMLASLGYRYLPGQAV